MTPAPAMPLEQIYPLCRRVLGEEAWRRLAAECDPAAPEDLAEVCAGRLDAFGLPPYLPELAALEWARHAAATADVAFSAGVDGFEVNPTLNVLHLSHRLTPLFDMPGDGPLPEPEPGEEWALAWREPRSGHVRVAAASPNELLALKLVVEEMPPERAAEAGGVAVHTIDEVLATAAGEGLLLAPASRIVRVTTDLPEGDRTPARHTTVHTFTLQWHITQACDLHCRHCYDRSDRSTMTLEQGLAILRDMDAFCRDRRVLQHVCFTGGNPLLHPHFLDLYRAAAAQGAVTSVLGNPARRRQVEEIIEVQPPRFYQVSLEGLQEQNDRIRGAGHFARTLAFLDVLRDLGVNSAVMLTLTADNVDEVIPLAEVLRGRTDYFTFNRLSPVGEGADLLLPTRERYEAFLEEYLDACARNPIMGIKDNLLNIVLERRGMETFGGCTGYGCGAAFNFLAVLPDGEAHACRKFPSPVGNVLTDGLAGAYDSEEAARYRRGAAACAGCRLRPVCGGCLASARGFGLDFFDERDPMCFVEGRR